MAEMEGTYELTSSDKFVEYMKAVGVGVVMRNMAAAATPKTFITHDAATDEWNFKTTTTFKTSEIKFKFGEEFKEETADGRKCLSTITKEADGRLKHLQKCDGKEYVLWREFTPTEMKMVLEVPEVTCTRVYKRL